MKNGCLLFGSCLVLLRSRGNGIRGSSCLAPSLCCRAMLPRATLAIHPAPCQLLAVLLQHSSSSRHNPPSLGSRLSAIKIPAFLVPTPPPPHHHPPLAARATFLTSQCTQTRGKIKTRCDNTACHYF